MNKTNRIKQYKNFMPVFNGSSFLLELTRLGFFRRPGVYHSPRSL